MPVDYIPNHVERALGNLESQFQRSPNLKAVLRAIIAEVQVLEDAIFSAAVDRYLESARGAQLDQYGKVLGAGRGGLTDRIYRQILGARILGNLSSGSVPRLLDIYRILNGGAPADVQTPPPNTLIFSTERDTPTTPDERRRIARWMHQVKKAGVRLVMVEASPGYFGFADDPDALGFDDGFFAGVI